MTCPDRTTLVSLLDEELRTADRQHVEAHASGCAACAKTLSALTALDALLATDEPVAPGLRARLETIPLRVSHAGAWRRVAAAAVVLLAVGAMAYRLLDAPERTPDVPREPARPVADVPPPSFPERVRLALESADIDARDWLAEVAPRALPEVIALARAENADVARSAVRQLGRWGRIEAFPALRDALRRPALQRAALVALGRVGSPRAVDPVAAFLDRKASADLARAALVQIGGEHAARALSRAYASTRQPELLADLAAVGGNEAARTLTRLIARTGDTSRAALRALRAGGPALLRDVVALARGADEAPAQDALRVLEALRPVEATPALGSLLAHKTRRYRAARVLARVDTAEAVAVLLSAPRAYELETAFRLAGHGAEEALLERLKGGTRSERARVARLLAHCGGADAVDALEGLARERALAPVAIESIGTIGGQQAIAALARLADASQLRLEVIEALGATGHAASVPVLTMLAERHPSVRARVVAALSHVPTAEAVESIVVLDGRRRLRSQSARALAGMEPALVRETLTAMLETKHAARARHALSAVASRHARDSRFAGSP